MVFAVGLKAIVAPPNVFPGHVTFQPRFVEVFRSRARAVCALPRPGFAGPGSPRGRRHFPPPPWAARDGQNGGRRPGVLPMNRDKKNRGSESPGQFISGYLKRSGYQELPGSVASVLALELDPGAGQEGIDVVEVHAGTIQLVVAEGCIDVGADRLDVLGHGNPEGREIVIT